MNRHDAFLRITVDKKKWKKKGDGENKRRKKLITKDEDQVPWVAYIDSIAVASVERIHARREESKNILHASDFEFLGFFYDHLPAKKNKR